VEHGVRMIWHLDQRTITRGQHHLIRVLQGGCAPNHHREQGVVCQCVVTVLARLRDTHDTDSYKQANRQGIGWGETEVIIGKTPRLWNSHSARQIGVNLASGSERNIL